MHKVSRRTTTHLHLLCLHTGVGVLRLGWLTHYLSHAVVSGFMTGASITIGMSQVKYLLGELLAS